MTLLDSTVFPRYKLVTTSSITKNQLEGTNCTFIHFHVHLWLQISKPAACTLTSETCLAVNLSPVTHEPIPREHCTALPETEIFQCKPKDARNPFTLRRSSKHVCNRGHPVFVCTPTSDSDILSATPYVGV